MCDLFCRSPSVVIGYLMRLRRWRLNESYKWVHDRRAVVSLQEGGTCSHLRCTPCSAAHAVHNIFTLVDADSSLIDILSKQFYLSANVLQHICIYIGEAARLQQLEVQLFGESSTGFTADAAQQSPGSSQQLVITSHMLHQPCRQVNF